MARVHINSATFEELLSIPGVGAKIAAKIWELREDKGILELEDLREVPYMRITEAALESMDFSTSLPPNRGSNKFCKEEIGHQEKVQRIDSLIQARGRGQTEYSSQSVETPRARESVSTSPSQHINFQDGGELNRGFREDMGTHQDRWDRPMGAYGGPRDYKYEGETPRSRYSNAGDTGRGRGGFQNQYIDNEGPRLRDAQPESEAPTSRHASSMGYPTGSGEPRRGYGDQRSSRRDAYDQQGNMGGSDNQRQRGSMGVRPPILQKSLKYDGKTNWQAFYAKFSRLCQVSGWSSGECKDQLCWSLDGKPSEFYALLVERRHDLSYEDLVSKLAKRFGFNELPETAQVQFNIARQGGDETLEDWADTVQSLATKAFRHLPEDHMYQQAIMRLCQGASDKEGGMLASNAKPKSIEEAVDKIRWHQHNHQAIYGRSARKEVKSVSPEIRGRGGDHYTVCSTSGPVSNNAPSKIIPKEHSPKDVQDLKDQFHAFKGEVSGTLGNIMSEIQKLSFAVRNNARPPSRSPSPRAGNGGCFHCGEAGHFKRECPKFQRSNSPRPGGKKVTFQDNKGPLNSNGSTQEV
ncbi:uncharacterized protein [Mytilus edulis]|uniref:uncharacterized protein n=1 Tax=Mytilus edulis TaxID=6550 RepID=UPI0039EE4D3E